MKYIMKIDTAKSLPHGVLINGSITMHKDHTGYVRDAYNVWLSDGNIPEPEHTQVELDEIKAWEERTWRNAQLSFADVEIYKVQDNIGTNEAEWREYRINLRAYPEKLDFPNGIRPVAP